MWILFQKPFFICVQQQIWFFYPKKEKKKKSNFTQNDWTLPKITNLSY